jgi:HPr kinase/phosphorylase
VGVALKITASDLFTELSERLQLAWVAGDRSLPGPALSSEDLKARPAMAGFLNLIHPNRVQVLGTEELYYIDSLPESEKSNTVSRMMEAMPVTVIVADGRDVPAGVLEQAGRFGTVVWASGTRAHELVNYLQYHIAKQLARRTTLHGVFMEMFTIGVLVTGDPGSGKSELALELITRGHRLIADDAPEFTQVSPEIIDGTCPEAIRDCLEVRGLGILNIRQMFGDAAIKLNKFLRLIIHLEVPPEGAPSGGKDRLRGDSSSLRVLELDVPRITLPVMAGRNLAVMAEAAVRDFMLRMKGYDAASEFIERHSRLLQRQKP